MILCMAVYLDCEICMQLCAEYGATIAALRTAATLAQQARMEAVLKAIEAHEAEAHPNACADAATAS
jgi:hypothetical protein